MLAPGEQPVTNVPASPLTVPASVSRCSQVIQVGLLEGHEPTKVENFILLGAKEEVRFEA